MIKIKNKKNENIVIEGHALFDDYGKDIVCASVSSIAITSVNAIIRINQKAINVTTKDGYLEIKLLLQDEVINILIRNMMELFKELQVKYPSNILVNEEV